MAVNLSGLDAGQVIRAVFDETSGSLRVQTNLATVNGTQEISINAADDSIAIGDGTNKATVTAGGALNVNVVNSGGTSSTVTVTNFPATQPVSASALPLPTGASTSAKQPALGTAGSAASDVITVQGIASMVALKVDNSGVTQPISGSVSISNFPATQTISGTVTANVGTTNGLALDATLTGGTQKSITRSGVKGTTTSADVTSTSVDVNTQALDVSVKGTPSVSVSNASIPVTGTFWQSTQPVSIATMPSTPVTGTFWQATQPVSGTVAVSNLPATQAISAAALPLPSGASTSAKQPALGVAGTASSDVLTVQGIASMTALKVDGSATTQPISGSVSVSNASIPVTGTFFQSTQPVSIAAMPSTPVTGTFWQATQPVSMASPIALSPSLSNNIAALNAAVTMTCSGYAVATVQITGTYSASLVMEGTIDGTNWVSLNFFVINNATSLFSTIGSTTGIYLTNVNGLTQFRVRCSSYTSGTAVVSIELSEKSSDCKIEGTVSLSTQSSASSNPIGSVSLGNSAGKTTVMKTGSLTTTAVTAGQVILTYTVTTGKTFYLQYLSLESRLTVLSATGAILGLIWLENPSGTTVINHTLTNGTNEAVDYRGPYCFDEPIAVPSATVIRVLCTPAATTSTLWIANFGGYEK